MWRDSSWCSLLLVELSLNFWNLDSLITTFAFQTTRKYIRYTFIRLHLYIFCISHGSYVPKLDHAFRSRLWLFRLSYKVCSLMINILNEISEIFQYQIDPSNPVLVHLEMYLMSCEVVKHLNWVLVWNLWSNNI